MKQYRVSYWQDGVMYMFCMGSTNIDSFVMHLKKTSDRVKVEEV